MYENWFKYCARDGRRCHVQALDNIRHKSMMKVSFVKENIFLSQGGCWQDLIGWTTLEYSCSDLPANQVYSKISNNFTSNIYCRELVCIFGVVCIFKFRVNVFYMEMSPLKSAQTLFSLFYDEGGLDSVMTLSSTVIWVGPL